MWASSSSFFFWGGAADRQRRQGLVRRLSNRMRSPGVRAATTAVVHLGRGLVIFGAALLLRVHLLLQLVDVLGDLFALVLVLQAKGLSSRPRFFGCEATSSRQQRALVPVARRPGAQPQTLSSTTLALAFCSALDGCFFGGMVATTPAGCGRRPGQTKRPTSGGAVGSAAANNSSGHQRRKRSRGEGLRLAGGRAQRNEQQRLPGQCGRDNTLGGLSLHLTKASAGSPAGGGGRTSLSRAHVWASAAPSTTMGPLACRFRAVRAVTISTGCLLTALATGAACVHAVQRRPPPVSNGVHVFRRPRLQQRIAFWRERKWRIAHVACSETGRCPTTTPKAQAPSCILLRHHIYVMTSPVSTWLAAI